MAKVRTVFESDDKDINATLARMHADMQRLIADNRKLASESRQFSVTSQGALGRAISQAATLAGSYLTVQQAIQAAIREHEDLLRRQREASGKQIDVAGLERQFLINLGVSVTDETRRDVQRQLAAISDEVKVPVSSLLPRAAEAVSARGGFSVESALDAVKQSARILPRDTEGGRAIAGGILDVSKLTGSSDALENLGVIVGTQELTRVTNLQQTAKNLIPAAIGISQAGDNVAEALALVSTITGFLAEPEGRLSATGGLKLSSQLQEFLPAEDTFKFITHRGRQVRVPEREGTGLESTVQRLEFLQRPENALLREEFMATASFEERAKPAIRALLDPNSGLLQLVKANVARIPTGDDARQASERLIQGINETNLQQNALLASSMEQATEKLLLDDTEGGTRGTVRDELERALSASGAGWFRRWATLTEFDFSGVRDPRVHAAQLLRGRAESIVDPGFRDLLHTPQQRFEALPEQERERVRILQSLADDLVGRAIPADASQAERDQLLGIARGELGVRDPSLRGRRRFDVQIGTTGFDTALRVRQQQGGLDPFLEAVREGNRLTMEQNELLKQNLDKRVVQPDRHN